MNALKNERGFSLMEILISMTIFGISMMGLAGMSGVAVKTNLSSARVTAATAAAQEKIEYVKGLGFSTVDAAAGTENYGSVPQNKFFKRVTTVTTDPTNVNIKTVMVTVYWRSDKSNISIQTLVSKANL
jgi:prepilin-type N-terminal cleavage/methylation domain-containing protein